MSVAMRDITVFQSTLPREERLISQEQLKRMNVYFNPRSHERSDVEAGGKDVNEMISIHAPTRGATCEPLYPDFDFIFQSTLPREERRKSSRGL